MSFIPKIHKNWLSETDTDPKNGLDTGSTETVSRYVPALEYIPRGMYLFLIASVILQHVNVLNKGVYGGVL